MSRGRAGLTWDGNPKVKPPFGTVRINWGHPLARGLVGCWLFNEGGGGKAYDLTRRNDGTLTNGPVWTPGRVGQALSFDGVNDHVDVGNGLGNSLAQITVCARVRFANLTADHPVVYKLNSLSVLDGFYLWGYDVATVSGRTDVISWYVAKAGTTNRIEGATNSKKQNAWQHLCATFQGNTTGGMRLFIDGVEDANSPITTTIADTSTPTANLMFGKRVDVAGHHAGVIDDVRIYNRALSAIEVLQLYVEPYAFSQSVIPRRYFVPAAAGLSIPVAMQSYRQRRVLVA